jgi:protein involved in polysaccharide export with SLBB domain
MREGGGESGGRGWLLGPLLALALGCAGSRPSLEQALHADRTPTAHQSDVLPRYRVHCPDVLELQVAGAADWSGRQPVAADGRISLGDGSRLRVDGQTPPEIAAAVAAQAGTSAGEVRVRVAEFNSQQVYLFGEVTGQQRPLPYRGPESVLDLLRRAGGITPGAAPADVQVVRAHVAEGKTPEIFRVDLPAILLRHDQHTNVLLEPFDQVYVGQTRRSTFCPCFPPWLRPTYETLCGMRRHDPGAAPSSPAN